MVTFLFRKRDSWIVFSHGLYIESMFYFSLNFVFLCFDKGVLELLGPEGLVNGVYNVFLNKIFVFEDLSFFFFEFHGLVFFRFCTFL